MTIVKIHIRFVKIEFCVKLLVNKKHIAVVHTTLEFMTDEHTTLEYTTVEHTTVKHTTVEHTTVTR